jgi:hypothetical protein
MILLQFHRGLLKFISLSDPIRRCAGFPSISPHCERSAIRKALRASEFDHASEALFLVNLCDTSQR